MSGWTAVLTMAVTAKDPDLPLGTVDNLNYVWTCTNLNTKGTCLT